MRGVIARKVCECEHVLTLSLSEHRFVRKGALHAVSSAGRSRHAFLMGMGGLKLLFGTGERGGRGLIFALTMCLVGEREGKRGLRWIG